MSVVEVEKAADVVFLSVFGLSVDDVNYLDKVTQSKESVMVLVSHHYMDPDPLVPLHVGEGRGSEHGRPVAVTHPDGSDAPGQ